MKMIMNNIRDVYATIKINKTLFKPEAKALKDPFLRKSKISPHLRPETEVYRLETDAKEKKSLNLFKDVCNVISIG